MVKHVTMSTVLVQMDAMRDLKEIFAKQIVVLLNTDEIVRADAAIIVTTTKFVILTSDAVADALTVIKMQNVIKNAIVEPMERTVRTHVGNALML